MGIEASLESPLARAVRAVGSQSAYARLVRVSQSTVFRHLREGQGVQPEHVFAVEAATGISRHELRPDIYPPEPARAPLTGRRHRDTPGLESAR